MSEWQFVQETNESILLKIAVKPNSRKQELVIEPKENFLFIRLLSPPDKGKANKELLKLLSNFFNISLSNFQITAGHTSRNKVVKVSNVTKEAIRDKLLEEIKNKG